MTKIRFLGSLAAADSLSAQVVSRELEAEVVNDLYEADFVILRPDDLDELIEDALAAAAYERTRNQEFLPAEMVDRLLAGESRVRVWREYRGLTIQQLTSKANLASKGYLSDIETGRRRGTIETMKKIAAALTVELDDLTG